MFSNSLRITVHTTSVDSVVVVVALVSSTVLMSVIISAVGAGLLSVDFDIDP
jgi:hypothetical protein